MGSEKREVLRKISAAISWGQSCNWAISESDMDSALAEVRRAIAKLEEK